MGEYDRKEFIQRQSVAQLTESLYRRMYPNEKLVPLMHKILAKTDVTDEQKYRNAMRINKELEAVRDGPEKSQLFEKTQPIIADLYDLHHKKTKHLPDDENFWVLVEEVQKEKEKEEKETEKVEEITSDPIDVARDTVVDVAEEGLGFWGNVAKVGGALGAGAILTAKTGFNLAKDVIDLMPTPTLNVKKDETQPIQKKEEKEEIKKEQVAEVQEKEEPPMKAKQKILLSRFTQAITDGMPIEDAVKIYRSKSQVDKGESYEEGILRLGRDPHFVHGLTDEQLETITTKYAKWEAPPQLPAGTPSVRWPAGKKRKAPDQTITNQETSIAVAGDPPAPEPKYPNAKYLLGAVGAAIGAVGAASLGVSLATGAAVGGAVSYMNAADNEIKDNDQKYLPKINELRTPIKQPEPEPETDYDYDYQNFQTESDALLAQQRVERENAQREKKQKLDNAADLPTIPSDSAQYSIKPELDPTQAALAGIQQFLSRAGLSAGGYATQRLLALGGPYGYLGAAAVGTGTLTLDAMNRHFSEHYTKPYSERRGVNMANQLYNGFPALSAERGINSLESSSLGERSNTNVVNAFANSGNQLGGRGQNLIAQENMALQNYLQESQSPFVVPH